MASNQNMVLIFGAGASKGSDINGTPPLARDLLASLRQFNPEGWGQLDTHLDELFVKDFEKGMERLPELGSKIPGMWKTDLLFPLQKTMALYFFTFVPDVTNLYVKLARTIKDSGWRGLLVSLNYERLLEISLRFNFLTPVIGASPSCINEIELCLPHGCCNLFCEHHLSATFTHQLINEIFDGDVVKVNCPGEFMRRLEICRAPPVMSFFTADKISASGQFGFLDPQRRRFQQTVLSAKRIAVVGIQLRPHDKHIWEPLAKTSANLLYCSGSAAVTPFLNWRRDNGRTSSDVVLDCYFADAFDELVHWIGIR